MPFFLRLTKGKVDGMRRTALLVCAVMASLVLTSVTFFVAQEDTHAATSALSGKTVVIDPGHGGNDSGAQNSTYSPPLLEKNQNLDVAYKLKGLLQASGARVYMTRGGDPTGNADDCYPDDATLSNGDRYVCANSLKASHPGTYVLVSIHMNASTDKTIDYTTTLYGKPRKDKALANTVFGSLSALPAANGTGTIATRTPYQFASGVLLKSDMPATIAETVFITNVVKNVGEGALLSDGTGTRQQQIAEALEAGLESYFLK
jgi:N-acetylmuramoyl-L-alanine amidase